MLCALVAGLVTPTIWIVDAAGGPGTHFTNLPPAIAVAQSGDTILVRAGSYLATAISGKALVIRGAGAAVTFVASAVVGNVPASGQVVLSGLTFYSSAPLNPAVDVVGPGRVVMLDCVANGAAGMGAFWASADGLRVGGGAVVHATRCSLRAGNLTSSGASLYFSTGSGALVQGNSRLVATACTLRGGNLTALSVKTTLFIGGAGVHVLGGEAAVCGSDCFGGSASSPFVVVPGGSAVAAYQTGSARVSGAGTLQGGVGNHPASGPVASYTVHASNGGSAVVHAGVNLVPALPGASVIGGAVTMNPVTMPHLTAQASALTSGETNAALPLTLTFDAQLPNAPAALVVGFQPAFVAPFAPLMLGTLFVDLAGAAIVTGTLDVQGRFSFSFVPVAVFGSMLGIPFFSQAGAFDVVSLQFRASNVDERIFAL